MNRTLASAIVFAAAITGLSASSAVAGSVNINIGGPTVVAPPVVVAPPSVVVVPGTAVYTVPSASFNVFVYQQRYYSFHNDAWFVAVGPGQPWKVVAMEAVPHQVRAVPVSYYRIPPGQAKKMEKKMDKEWKDDSGHGRDKGQGKHGR
jgi:hypothetical protein